MVGRRDPLSRRELPVRVEEGHIVTDLDDCSGREIVQHDTPSPVHHGLDHAAVEDGDHDVVRVGLLDITERSVGAPGHVEPGLHADIFALDAGQPTPCRQAVATWFVGRELPSLDGRGQAIGHVETRIRIEAGDAQILIILPDHVVVDARRLDSPRLRGGNEDNLVPPDRHQRGEDRHLNSLRRAEDFLLASLGQNVVLMRSVSAKKHHDLLPLSVFDSCFSVYEH